MSGGGGGGGDGPTRVAVVGGGLVGALNACYLARRGLRVDLYESREDLRSPAAAGQRAGRSINLALSHRGRQALAGVGLEERVTSIGVPMRARMIHSLSGHRRAIPYGTGEQCIMSVDRRRLNECLLTSAEGMDNVTLHFGHRLVSCDPDTGQMTFSTAGSGRVEAMADVIMGNDGAYSSVRMQLMKPRAHGRLNYSQEYIPHGYKELCMPATAAGHYAMEVNYLHIWPRGQFMMIALPNLDKTYTVTLFMPFEIFDTIRTKEDLLGFFTTNFPDSIPLLGEDRLSKDYFSVKAQSLVSIKCSPYHIKDKVLLMGDAAHAMVPFYGQGMNAGFEDCLILDSILDECGDNFAEALPRFSEYRGVDAHAICDLALYNYVEMRDLVNSPKFLLRKKLDNMLHYLFPRAWVPLYTSVSFTRIMYHECIRNREWQDRLLSRMISAALLATGGAISLLTSALLLRKLGHALARRVVTIAEKYAGDVASSGEYYFAPAGRIITSSLKVDNRLMK